VILLFLSVLKILQGSSNVFIISWLEVVVSVLGIIMPFGSGCFGSHDEFVVQLFFDDSQIVLEITDLVVFTEVGDSIVDIVAKPFTSVFILGATG